MELLLFIVVGIVWAVIKALSANPVKPPPPRQSVKPPKPPGELSSPMQTPFTTISFSDSIQPAMEVENLEEQAQDSSLSLEDVIQGVVMAEVLSPPRARRPHRFR